MRRAMRHAWLLGQKQPIVLYEMVRQVQKLMSDAYPELTASGQVVRVVAEEERRFHHTMEIGLERLEQHLKNLRVAPEAIRSVRAAEAKARGEAEALLGPFDYEPFRLYDTFGLPRDFIEDAYRDAGVPFDNKAFDLAMAEQRERARASWKGAAKQTANPAYQQLPKSTFEGYSQTRSNGCEVLAIIHNGQGVQELKPG